MDSQYNATLHIDLRHKDFKKLCVANFLFALSVYMLLPVLPLWLKDTMQFDRFQMSCVYAAFGIGVFSLGALCSYLIQRYRRNKVCVISMLLFALIVIFIAYSYRELLIDRSREEAFFIVVAARFIGGALFGLAFMVLNSTLIVDCCESAHRTRANVLSMWAYRFAVALGPLWGILTYQESGLLNTMYVSSALCIVALGILASVQFPFKAPDDNIRVFSFDRFFMPNSIPLFLVAVMVVMSLGVVFASVSAWNFYAMLAVGFAIAMFLQSYCPALRKMEWLTYLAFALVLGGVLMIFSRSIPLYYIGGGCLGFGIAALTSRLNIMLIHVGDHCQRGTSQSTYILAFELGISLGHSLAFYLDDKFNVASVASLIVTVACAVYFVLSLTWLKKNLRK